MLGEIVVCELCVSWLWVCAVLAWWRSLVLKVLVGCVVGVVSGLVAEVAFVIFGVAACTLPVLCVALCIVGNVG